MANGNRDGEPAGERVARLYGLLRPHLDERQRRLLLGAEALELGRGGIKAVAEATGVHPDTVGRGVREAEGRPEPRVRAPGGGRKKLAGTDQQLVPALVALVDPADPRGSGVAAALDVPVDQEPGGCADEGRAPGVGPDGGAAAARARATACRATRRWPRAPSTLTGTPSSATSPAGPASSWPPGTRSCRWTPRRKRRSASSPTAAPSGGPQGQPERVNVHDFPSDAIGKAIPYGIYDLGANTGWVSVGTDHDTSAFAAETLRRWWRADGSARYPAARRLLICADSGGSNAARARAWKVELARLAAETGLEITCCHYPPGTSKWNKVEHRLFAQITRNWRGRPLTSHQAIVELISATTTSTGLTVTAELDTSEYPTGLRYTSKQVGALPIGKHDFHPDWNYTVRPEPHETPVPSRKQTTRR